MDTASAFARGAASRGNPVRVFDWDNAARLIRERKPAVARAGLAHDWEYTGGTIAVNGDPVTTDYTYLASTWARPELDMDGEVVDCWVYQRDRPDWDAYLDARDDILRRGKMMGDLAREKAEVQERCLAQLRAVPVEELLEVVSIYVDDDDVEAVRAYLIRMVEEG